MLFIIGFAALGTSLLMWLSQRVGLFDVGQVRSVLLLVGLICLFLGVVKARDARLPRDSRK